MSRRPIEDKDRARIAQFIEQHWHSQVVMSRGKAYHPHKCDGFIEWRGDELVGLLTYNCQDLAMEILTLNSTLEGEGIGSALMLKTIEKARDLGMESIWLTTTNDNLRGIGFYQRLGYRMTAINLGVVDEARKIKPQIPTVGQNGIPIRDEIVMELNIKPSLSQ